MEEREDLGGREDRDGLKGVDDAADLVDSEGRRDRNDLCDSEAVDLCEIIEDIDLCLDLVDDLTGKEVFDWDLNLERVTDGVVDFKCLLLE